MTKSSIQIFIENTGATLLTILRVFLLSKFNVKMPHGKVSECVILGNGPSLQQFLNKSLNFLQGKEVCCVNFFARTEEYVKIKPSYYLITSPEYFVGEQKEHWVKDRNLTLKAIADKTTWPMFLIVPSFARKAKEWQLIMSSNQLIKIVYFNNTPIEGFEWIKYWCFKKNIGIPRPHNVLIPSIMICLNMKFDKVYLTGADHSWTKEILVTKHNQVLLSQKHFYDNQVKGNLDKNSPQPQPMYLGGTHIERKLHEVLEKFVISFRSYWEIEKYAQSLNRRVINITPDSFIDAFERMNVYEK